MGEVPLPARQPKGLFKERWLHAHGCRRWFNAERHTVTHEIRRTYKPGEAMNELSSLAGWTNQREKPLNFKFNGRALQGFAGDTLASALLANGVHLVARSFKYHRPRGILAAGYEEPNAIVQLEAGARHRAQPARHRDRAL
jgi:sarcosine oxidase subunit alpha